MYTNHTHEVHFLKNRNFQIEKIDWILLFLIQLQSSRILRKDLQFLQGGISGLHSSKKVKKYNWLPYYLHVKWILTSCYILKIILRHHEKSSETIRLKHKHDSLWYKTLRY